jgi:small subunit ribosomal protein S26e
MERKNMPVKRKSRGRAKGGKGRSELIHCDNCKALIPRDKAIKVTRPYSIVSGDLARELKQKGAYIAQTMVTKYYCVSCAIHFGIVKVRAKEERKPKLVL